ncbi:hypothetical protein RJ641_020386 [Dillenia turbinata]|uniref:Uncharacterized protein n=1 Tax=Dillenia turbinata TaxID=194707 RepID=A0AAN8YU27_9MAGN
METEQEVFMVLPYNDKSLRFPLPPTLVNSRRNVEENVSKLGFGCMSLTRFSTQLGPIRKAIKQLPRDQIQLATKFGIVGIGPTGGTNKGNYGKTP